MIANHIKTALRLTAVTVMIVMLAGAGAAQAAAPPVKLEPSTPITSGFQNPEGVAVASGGNIYVVDRGNHRVQELTATGTFVLMFGKEVNETTKGNICTEEEVAKSGVKCKAGVEGTAAAQFAEVPMSVTVNPTSDDVYIAERMSGAGYGRVQEFTAGGQFVLEIGKAVNETTKGNLCTQEEVEKASVKCGAPVIRGSEPGAFNFAQFAGDLLAVGPAPEHLLYVGDEHRVQEFDGKGEWKGEIPLTAISAEPGSKVVALAVDAVGDVYLDYIAKEKVLTPGGGFFYQDGPGNIVREFNPSGVEVNKFTVSPRQPGNEVVIDGIALDSEGRLAVSAGESGPASLIGPFGSLYNASAGHLITRFTISGKVTPEGIAFNGKSELYAADTLTEVLTYVPVNVAELLTGPVTCTPGVESETDVTLDCSLNGEVNPEGVSETEVWFQWGRTPFLGEQTAKQSIKEPPGAVPLPVSAPIEGVRPNETFYDRLAGFDHNVKAPEASLTSETASFTTLLVAPKVVGEPSAPFVRAGSAVMFAELNPENASTSYEFQYGPCQQDNPEKCPESPYTAETPVSQSAVYGKTGTTQEVTGLQPATVYHYRLLAEDENTLKTTKYKATGPEGSFTTGPSPLPTATTGAPSALATTSATVSGTVNPDGQPATYAFELGVYAGGATQYGIVFSGSAGTGTAPVTEELGLTGLQPGTTYAYRIRVASGYGTQTGEPVLFTTEGLPALLTSPTVLALLPVPNIAFPLDPTPPRPLTAAQKLAKALKACKKGKSKKQRATCEKQARKKYKKK
jgi:hypothetical protein